eukprot:6112942-Pyramimonas_sp.AAC.1
MTKPTNKRVGSNYMQEHGCRTTLLDARLDVYRAILLTREHDHTGVVTVHHAIKNHDGGRQ